MLGEVTDSVTGVPIARARVSVMFKSDTRYESMETVTDSEGRFVLSHLPAGEYQLSIRKSGYLMSTAGERGPTLRGKAASKIQVVADQQQRVHVALVPQAILLGRVLAPDGEPLEGARVSLQRAPQLGRRRRPADAENHENSVDTNDAGEFRIPRVEPGSYVLRVLARHASFDSSSSRVPAPTYYPGVTSLAAAVPIDVARGATIAGLDVVLQEVETTTISGTVVDRRGQPVDGDSVQVWEVGNGLRVPVTPQGDERGDIRSGRFQLRVPVGEYELTAERSSGGFTGGVSFDPMQFAGKTLPTKEEIMALVAAAEREERERAGYGAVRVSVGADGLTDVTLQLEPLQVMSGRFVFEGRTPALEDFMYAQFACGDRMTGYAPLPDGAFELTVRPGTCTPTVMTPPGWSLKTVQIGGVDVTHRTLTLEGGKPVGDVRVLLTDRRNELSFTVVDQRGVSTTEFVAVVFPVDDSLWSLTQNIELYVPRLTTAVRPPRSDPRAFMRGPHSDYSLPLGGLAPGDYYAIALDDGTWEDLTDPATLERLAEKAVKFQIREGEIRAIELRRAARADF
jgi:protocatechuate 3,4-dioxygenase beta subunit